MSSNEEIMLPYMKRYNRETIFFEIKPLNSMDVIYMDDDEDAPIVIKASRPKRLEEFLNFISLINFSSDFRVMANGFYLLLVNRSDTIEEHFSKLYTKKSVSFTSSNESVAVHGLYIVPESFDPKIHFRRLLLDGELCKDMGIQEIVDKYFQEFQFSYVIHVEKAASCEMSQLQDALVDCCRQIIQSFLFDLKEIASRDLIPDDPWSNLTICDKKSENCDVSLIDVDDIPDESELENNVFMSCTDDLMETCEFSIGKYQETLLKRMWFTQKWMRSNSEHMLLSQKVDVTDLHKILAYIPTQGTALKFWKPPETENLRRSKRLKKPTSTETKSIYIEDDNDDDDVCFIDVQRPRRPFNYDNPKKITPSLSPQCFDILKDDDLDNYVKPLHETSPPKSMFLDDGGIILSSDDENEVSKPKKFFVDRELAQKRRSLLTKTVSKKPEFVRTTRKSTAYAALGNSDNTRSIKSFFSSQNTANTSKMREIQDSMLMDIDAPRKLKEEQKQKIKALVKRHHEGNARTSKMFDGTNRSSKILVSALNDIKKQAEDDSNKMLFNRYLSPEPGPSRESSISASGSVKLSYFHPVSFEVKLKQHSLVDMMASPSVHQKKEINFDHIDYE
ncbi:uncharacterized protein LOC134838220 isoform X1 [Culicoides brevitarsis]|uniref:uncharacterized protein LOC134838220 isoform X1 n=1 Tax=Culicoides brevitarsis TaxID=469753 RepID=UPI00307BF144